MLEVIIVILGISLLLYTILGGADFGAGMIEVFTGKQGQKTISKAIAPVWEANHVWLVLVVVIIFTGFPRVYTVISTALHIPLFVMLIGIIFRGAAFTFRYYDVSEDRFHRYYTTAFRLTSFLTPFFLGVVLGAMIYGKITTDYQAGFMAVYINPWWNVFCVLMGLFVATLFAYVAALFLNSEPGIPSHERLIYGSYAKRIMILLVLLGMGIIGSGHGDNFALFREFLQHPVSLGMLALATLLTPFIWRGIDIEEPGRVRLLAGVQVTAILMGWFAVQFPVIVNMPAGGSLTFYNASAVAATLRVLLGALIVGVLLILPSIYYLFRVFKSST